MSKSGCHFPRGHTDIVRRKYLNLTGNTDKTGHWKEQLLKFNFFLTHIIIIYYFKSEYLKTTTVLLILYMLNARNGCHCHMQSVYVMKMTP